MKRGFLVFSVVLISLALSSSAFAGPVVAIVKSDNHELVGEDYTMPFTCEHEEYDKLFGNKDLGVNGKNIFNTEAQWGPESEAAIEQMVRKAIELAGDFPVKKGDTVIIKPNIVSDLMEFVSTGKMEGVDYQATTTDPRVCRGVALVALEAGAKKVYFAELPAHGDAYASLIHFGYVRVAKELDKKFPGRCEALDLRSQPYAYYKPPTGGLALKEYAIPKILVEADVVISVPVMKTHVMAGVTLSLKNIGIGAASTRVYGQWKMGLPHQRLADVIVDVCSIVGIDYTVVDAIWALEGNGPLIWLPGAKPIAMDMVVAGKDPVAVDYVTTETMGWKGDIIGSTRLGAKNGLGSYRDVELRGTPIGQVTKTFSYPDDSLYPRIYARSVGWGPEAPK